jgi:hypothetical protein
MSALSWETLWSAREGVRSFELCLVNGVIVLRANVLHPDGFRDVTWLTLTTDEACALIVALRTATEGP